jgi:hypothetical protein
MKFKFCFLIYLTTYYFKKSEKYNFIWLCYSILVVFDIVITVVFQSVFRMEMHQNNIF